MSEKKKRYAMELSNNSIVINATEAQLKLIKASKLELELVKTTPKYSVYRIKK